MSFMMAFGWAGIMILIGVFLRARIVFLRNMLVPASVIAGVVGILCMNVADAAGIHTGTDITMFTTIVNHLFTVSFISISLTRTPEDGGNRVGNTLRGAVGMGLVWCFLYALTPLLSFGIVCILGQRVNMNGIYGMLIQFAFCQGPGQSASYGLIFEQYGWEHAAMVAIALSAIGFVAAFLVGIPAAKIGIKYGLAKNCRKIDDVILKGYYNEREQTGTKIKDTTCNSNIETLAFHFAVIGLCYVLAVGIGNVLSLLPGFLGTSMSGMMFMNGMYAAYIVRFTMRKLKLDFLLENTLQNKITGWTADYLVVCAFMSVSVRMISAWLIPVLTVAVLMTVVTFIICFYFGQRFGGGNDFERTLGMYGMCTGTVPSGIALVRIVDPEFRTSTSVELGACNLVMMASTPVYILILAYASGSLSLGFTLAGLALCAAVYLVLLKTCRLWGQKTFTWK